MIGLDYDYKVISGEIIRDGSGPVALRSKLGWILSGVVDMPEMSINLATNVVSSLVLILFGQFLTVGKIAEKFLTPCGISGGTKSLDSYPVTRHMQLNLTM